MDARPRSTNLSIALLEHQIRTLESALSTLNRDATSQIHVSCAFASFLPTSESILATSTEDNVFELEDDEIAQTVPSLPSSRTATIIWSEDVGLLKDILARIDSETRKVWAFPGL